MTPQEQNALGFEGDTFLKEEFEHLIKKHEIKVIVETGTYLGGTTMQLAKMVDKVYTIEINKEYLAEAKLKFAGVNNVYPFLGSSPFVLPRVIDILIPKKNILFFLDAHWLDFNPLLQEL